jgi:hypothetical protein
MKQHDFSALRGTYRDRLTDAQGRPVWDSGWRTNRVVDSCNALIAALMKAEPGFSGVLFWAVGAGATSWDNLMPSPLAADRQLSNEIARKAVVPADIVFLDDQDAAVAGPTSRLRIASTFTPADFGGQGIPSLREFGLFGGDATTTANSGWMIDYVIHPLIRLSAGMTLTRNLNLTFGLGGPGIVDLPGGFGATLQVGNIDGVGARFASALSAAGVRTLNDLIQLNPLQRIASIPPVRLREFRAKARMALTFRADLIPFTALSDRSISSLLQADPATLAAAIGVPAVTASHVIQLQDALAVLQVALDDDALQQITLGTLLPS